MSRPSHAMQQIKMDDTLATPMSARWRWLFTPDPRWLNTVNTTSLRTVNAIRMFVAITILFIVTYLGTVFYALTRCGILLKVGSWTLFQMMPPPGKLSVLDWRACEESLATARILDFASTSQSTYSLLLAAMAGIALGAMAVKRSTDTEHRVAVEEAKKAPAPTIIQTGEHMAQQPPPVTQEVTVNTGGAPAAVEQQGDIPAEGPVPAPPTQSREEHDADV